MPVVAAVATEAVIVAAAAAATVAVAGMVARVAMAAPKVEGAVAALALELRIECIGTRCQYSSDLHCRCRRSDMGSHLRSSRR